MSTFTLPPPSSFVTQDHEKRPTVLEASIEISSDEDEESGNVNVLPDHIISSPYIDPTHQLDLRSLSNPIARFAQALQSMRAIRRDYATAPYAQSFNWDEIVQPYLAEAGVPQVSFFVIVFRSRLKLDADRPLLGKLDAAAHLEAVEAGGLLKYWFGEPDSNRRNLATCLWRARDDARLGGAGPGHAAAMIAARRMYDEWFVERLKLTVNVTGKTWRFEPWTESD